MVRISNAEAGCAELFHILRLGLLISVLLMTYGLNLSVGFF
jgi:hypothetical protein